jgi:hypothetical protein
LSGIRVASVSRVPWPVRRGEKTRWWLAACSGSRFAVSKKYRSKLQAYIETGKKVLDGMGCKFVSGRAWSVACVEEWASRRWLFFIFLCFFLYFISKFRISNFHLQQNKSYA